MGAFCVFGVSRTALRKKAEKTTPTAEGKGKDRRNLSAPEWGEKVAAEVERLFAESEKLTRISPELDAPQFCRDWIAASPSDVKLTAIMCRGPKIDKHGATVVRNGVPVLTWLPYDESAPYPRPFGE